MRAARVRTSTAVPLLRKPCHQGRNKAVRRSLFLASARALRVPPAAVLGPAGPVPGRRSPQRGTAATARPTAVHGLLRAASEPSLAGKSVRGRERADKRSVGKGE